MDPQVATQISVSEVAPPTPPIVPETPKVERDNHWLPILAMAIFIILSLGVVVFLYYQNQQLKTMLASYQTPAASPTPVASSSPDPTANWKTYTNNKNQYSFKYPNSWVISQYGSSANHSEALDTQIQAKTEHGLGTTPDLKVNYFFVIGEVTTPNLKNWINTAYQDTKLVPQETKINNLDLYTLKDALSYDGTLEYFIVTPTKDKYIHLNLTPYDQTTPLPNQSEIVNATSQILSTFKFTEATDSASPAPIQKACTMEVRVCPDGSSVARTGPNCEFAPCP